MQLQGYTLNMYKVLKIELEKEESRQKVIISEIARLRNQMMGMENTKRLNRYYESGEIKKPTISGDVAVLVPVLNEGKNQEGIVQAKHGDDVPGKSRCLSAGKIDWTCSLCQITAPSEQALQKHLRSKKHNLKKDALKVKGTEENSIMGLSPRTSNLSSVETPYPYIDRDMSTTKTLLPLNTNEVGLMEQYLPLLQKNTNSVNLKGNQSEVEWKCTLCKVVCANERSLNEHLQGKKHRLKEAKTEFNSVALTKSVQAKETALPSMDHRVNFTFESVLNGKTGKICLKELDQPALLENLSGSDSQKSRSTLTQNADWSCAQCQIIAPSERALADHLRGKKHKVKGDALQAGVAEKNCSIVVGTMHPTMNKEVKLTNASLKERGLLLSQENHNSNDLEKNQHLLHKKVEWTCVLCKVVTTSKQDLGQHLLGKKHKLKEATLKYEGPRKNHGMESSPVTAKMSVVGTMDPCKQGALKCTSESLLFMKNGEASLKGHDLHSLQENMSSGDLARTQSTLNQKVEWSCALCEVVAPNKQALNDHLQGKKHKSKEASAKIASVMATRSTQAVEPLDSSAVKGVKFANDSLLHGKIWMVRSKKSSQPSLPKNLNDGNLEKSLFSLAEWNCTLCEVFCTSEQALNEHLQGKKHKEKSASRSEGPGNNHGIKPSTVTTALSSVKTTGSSKEDGMKFTDESLLLVETRMASLKEQEPPTQAPNKCQRRRKHRLKEVALRAGGTKGSSAIEQWKHSEEASSKGQNVALLYENQKSDGLNKDRPPLLVQNPEWSCPLCKVIATSERALEDHRHGKKHKAKEAVLVTDVAGKSIPLMTPMESVGVVETMNESLKEEDLLPFEDCLSPNSSNENHGAFANAKLICDLCQVTTPAKQALNKHVQGNKHQLNEESFTSAGIWKNSINGFYQEIAIESVPLVTTIDPNLDEGLKSVAIPFQLKDSKGHDVQQLLQGNLKSSNLNGNQSIFSQSMQENGDLKHEKVVEYGNRATSENTGEMPDKLRYKDDEDQMSADWKKSIVTWLIQKGSEWLNQP